MRRLRPILLALPAALALAGALAPPASALPAPDAEARAIAEARAARGRWCPPTGCGPPPPASLSSLGGFAAATLGALALGRRRSR